MSEMKPKLEVEGFSIIALGSFNPAIFHPSWFSHNGLVREEESSEAQVQIVSSDIAVVSFAWFNLQAVRERIVVDSADATKIQPLRDLVAAIFTTLDHTPIYSFGFNTNRHFRLGAGEDLDRFFQHFAPVKPWDGVVDKPRIRSLAIEGVNASSTSDRIHVKLEPSVSFKPGIYVSVNQHYAAVEAGEEKTSEKKNRLSDLLNCLQCEWTEFHKYSSSLSDALFAVY